MTLNPSGARVTREPPNRPSSQTPADGTIPLPLCLKWPETRRRLVRAEGDSLLKVQGLSLGPLGEGGSKGLLMRFLQSSKEGRGWQPPQEVQGPRAGCWGWVGREAAASPA